MSDKTKISLAIDGDLLDRLDAAAAHNDRSRQGEINHALRKHVTAHEAEHGYRWRVGDVAICIDEPGLARVSDTVVIVHGVSATTVQVADLNGQNRRTVRASELARNLHGGER